MYVTSLLNLTLASSSASSFSVNPHPFSISIAFPFSLPCQITARVYMHTNKYTSQDSHMYPSCTSSSSQKPMGSTGLTRYGSAPGSLLTKAVDAVVGAEREFAAVGSRSLRGQYFTGDSSSVTSESTCEVKPSYNNSNKEHKGLQRSYGFDEMNLRDFTTVSHLKNVDVGVVNGIGETCSSSSSALLRQRSSPAGFLSHLNVTAHNGGASDNGFSVSRVTGSYNSQGGADSGHRVSRLKSQLSFTGQDSSQVSKISRNVDGMSSDNSHHSTTHSYATTSFGMDTWDNSNSIVFSASPNKRAKNYDGDIFFNTLESQFSLPQTSLEMATVERLLNIPEDSVPCKIRAKRGCATHPRSIAERERRTRISGKLKKLQELVPNMDKQTSYADMLDLAVQHIKGLQGQVQKLQKELENCTCGCKDNS